MGERGQKERVSFRYIRLHFIEKWTMNELMLSPVLQCFEYPELLLASVRVLDAQGIEDQAHATISS